jgi:hypothetical protein
VLAIYVLAIYVLAIYVLTIYVLTIYVLTIRVLAFAPGFVTVAAPATASVRAPALQTGTGAFGPRRRRRKRGRPPRAYQALTASSRTCAARTRCTRTGRSAEVISARSLATLAR